MNDLIGVLAIATLVIVVIYAIVHFGGFLKGPKARRDAHNALVGDGKSATAQVREGAHPDVSGGRTLKQRLDDSQASTHPMEPTAIKDQEPYRPQ